MQFSTFFLLRIRMRNLSSGFAQTHLARETRVPLPRGSKPLAKFAESPKRAGVRYPGFSTSPYNPSRVFIEFSQVFQCLVEGGSPGRAHSSAQITDALGLFAQYGWRVKPLYLVALLSIPYWMSGPLLLPSSNVKPNWLPATGLMRPI